MVAIGEDMTKAQTDGLLSAAESQTEPRIEKWSKKQVNLAQSLDQNLLFFFFPPLLIFGKMLVWLNSAESQSRPSDRESIRKDEVRFLK